MTTNALEDEETLERLSSKLRHMRLQMGLTGKELGRRAGISQSKLSKIELRRVIPTVADVKALAMHANADEALFQELMDLAHSLEDNRVTMVGHAKLRGNSRQQWYMDHEDSARTIQYLSTIIPGLFQIPDYTRELLKREDGIFDIENPEQIVVSRARRKAGLINTRRTYEFVMFEHALAMPLANSSTMVQQIDSILTESRRPNVTLSIVPLDQPLNTCTMGNYVIIDSEIALEETLTADIEVRNPSLIATYQAHFQTLFSDGLTGQSAVALLQKYRDRFSHDWIDLTASTPEGVAAP